MKHQKIFTKENILLEVPYVNDDMHIIVGVTDLVGEKPRA